MSSFLIRLVGSCAVLSIAAAVLNGESVKSLEEFPYLVAVLHNGENVCGGTLIRLGVVLTAAHCVRVKMNTIEVRVGTLSTDGKGNTLPVKQKTPHPNYDSKTEKNDIAILILKGNFKPSKQIGTIDLPQRNEQYNQVEGTIVGWGDLVGGVDATVLQSTTTSIFNYTDCLKLYGPEVIFDTQYCIYDNSKTKALCSGDSGGPLVIHFQKRKDIFVGVNSWTYQEKGECSANKPSVATNVENYLDWIQPYLDKYDGQNEKPPTKSPSTTKSPPPTKPKTRKPKTKKIYKQ